MSKPSSQPLEWIPVVPTEALPPVEDPESFQAGISVQFRHDVDYMRGRVKIPAGTKGFILSLHQKGQVTYCLVRLDRLIVFGKNDMALARNIGTAYVPTHYLLKT